MTRPPKLLGLKAIAKALGVQPDNLQKEADDGRIPHVRVGEDYLFLLDQVEAALARRAEIKRGGPAALDAGPTSQKEEPHDR